MTDLQIADKAAIATAAGALAERAPGNGAADPAQTAQFHQAVENQAAQQSAQSAESAPGRFERFERFAHGFRDFARTAHGFLNDVRCFVPGARFGCHPYWTHWGAPMWRFPGVLGPACARPWHELGRCGWGGDFCDFRPFNNAEFAELRHHHFHATGERFTDDYGNVWAQMAKFHHDGRPYDPQWVLAGHLEPTYPGPYYPPVFPRQFA